MNEYLGEEALKVIVSPGRVAYLVPEGDAGAFQRAVALASSRWAGVTEPILAVQPDGTMIPADIQIAETLDLVALIDVDCPTGVSGGIVDLDLPVMPQERLDRSMDVRSLPWHAAAPVAGGYVAARSNGLLWEKVTAGIDDTESGRWAAATEDQAGQAALAHRSILDAGLAGFAESEVINARSGPILLWITEADSLSDCQAFWNYRALRCLRWPASPTYLLPARALRDWLGLEESLRRIVHERQFAGRPDVVINSLSVNDAQLRLIGEQLGLTYEASKELILPLFASIADRSLRTEFSFTTDVDPREWLLYDRTFGYDEWFRVQTFRQNTAVPVLPESLRPVVVRHAGIPLRLRLSGGFLEELPRTASTAQAVLNTANWTGQHLQSIVGISSNGRLNINAPSQEEVLQLVTRDVAGQVSLSDKGRLAASLLQRHDCNVLTAVSSLAAIQALTTRRSKALIKELSRLQDPLPDEIVELLSRLGGRVERNNRSAGKLQVNRLSPSQAVDVLENLTNRGWVERGFEVSCQACGMTSFIPVTSAARPTLCPQCDTTSELTCTEAGVEMYYRLDAFADRCSDQGVVTHAAVGSVLLASHPFSALHLGADITWEVEEVAEVDILGFLGAQLVAGEIKTSATEFTDDQIDRDISLSARLGAQAHVLAYIWPSENLNFLDRARAGCAEARLDLLVVRPNNDGPLTVERSRHRLYAT
jgi:hypothetical protein